MKNDTKAKDVQVCELTVHELHTIRGGDWWEAGVLLLAGAAGLTATPALLGAALAAGAGGLAWEYWSR